MAAGAFVARRVIGYLNRGVEVIVATMSVDRPLRHLGEITRNVKSALEFSNFLEQFQPHVIAIHSPLHTNLTGLAVEVSRQLNLPYVVWIHGFEALYTAFHNYQEGWKVPYSLVRDFVRMRWLKRTLENASAAIFVSDWMKNVAIRYTGAKIRQSYVIPNPVDTKTFYPVKKNIDGLLKVISVRGLDKKYGIDLAIRAFAGLQGAHLTIIGDGRYKENYMALANTLGINCTFLKPRYTAQELSGLYQFTFS